MSRIIDSDLENRLREVDDGDPDYVSMRRRIVEEAGRRRSGWKEVTPAAGRTVGRKWAFPAASAALACAVAVGVLAWQPDSDPDVPAPSYGAPAGQSLEASAVVDGVKLTLNSAVQGHFEGTRLAAPERKDRLAMQMSLSGLNVPNAEYAGFGSGRLIDLDSGKSKELTSGAYFDLRTGMDSAKLAEGDWTKEGETRRLRLEMDDLYVIRRHEAALQGKLQPGTEYKVPSLPGTSVLLTGSEWDKDQGLLTLTYKLQGAEENASASYPESLSIESKTQLLLNAGSKAIEPTSGTWNGNEVNCSYQLYDMSEQERQALTLTYSYAETVRKIDGSWKVDFTLDGSKAIDRAVAITPENAAEIEQKTGWTLGEAVVGAYGVSLPIEREPQNREPHDGLVLYYQKQTLVSEGAEFGTGEYQGGPLQLISGQAGQEQQALSFRILSADIRSLKTGPLSVRLQDAVVLRQAPGDFWTPLAAPRQEEQNADAELPDGSALHHRYLREGDDLKVVTETKDRLQLLEGTVLKVNGEVRKPDKNSSYNSYREQGDYRIDIYKNVPKDAELELGLGLYGQVDPSLNTEIVLRK
ncbi:hypothetical protein [Saccharibacillus alkalitolerans]|uniref:DUF4179 domain-containing protein n=1 Tax=Saccharibacillus alkalitolerans TaxID=2705290 RepID=A0ABX0F1N0_9BACL|nr:hypothetical protein [Saccharibacillus alkalitolerans]NGZ74887.1 hypothetical protein [Saccharibacillus alkalitolerans]